MAELSDFFVVIPVKKTRAGWFKHRWITCGREEAEGYRVMHRTGKGQWELINRTESASKAFSEAKRLAFMNRTQLLEVESVDPAALMLLNEMKF